MSYDVYLEVDAGGPEPVEAYWRNHTSNTSRMWREAGCDIAACGGHQAAQFAEGLAGAISAMEEEPEKYRQWEPENQWGTYETTLSFLRDLLDACRAYPRAVVRVSR
jgi:hypothetical protein